MPGRDRQPGGDDGAGDAEGEGHHEDRGQRRLPHQGRRDIIGSLRAGLSLVGASQLDALIGW